MLMVRAATHPAEPANHGTCPMDTRDENDYATRKPVRRREIHLSAPRHHREGMPGRTAPASTCELGTVGTLENDIADKTELSHERERLPRHPGGRPGRQLAARSSAPSVASRCYGENLHSPHHQLAHSGVFMVLSRL